MARIFFGNIIESNEPFDICWADEIVEMVGGSIINSRIKIIARKGEIKELYINGERIGG